MKIRNFLSLGLCIGLAAQAQTDSLAMKYAASILTEDLKEDLYVIAADSMQGRETGTEGQAKAAAYIAEHFQNSGIPPFNGKDYYQQYKLYRTGNYEASLVIEGNNYGFLEDFYFLPGSPALDQNEAEIVFAGYGLNQEGYNDYTVVDVKGKFVLVANGEPRDKEGLSHISGEEEAGDYSSWRAKAKLAQENGAAGIFIVDTAAEANAQRYAHYIERGRVSVEPPKANETPFITYFISPKMAQAMLKKDKKGWEKRLAKIAKKGQPYSAVVPSDLGLFVSFEQEELPAQNVLAYIEGSDLKEELIVITAHYDHIGAHDGKIFNGADDDGSGTVALMEIAEAFAMAKAEGNSPRRSILVMAVSGEEMGLLGSIYYTDNPVFPLENTVANLNIDMIGRMDEAHEGNPNYIYLIGSDKLSSELHEISEQANEEYTQLELDYTFNEPNDPNRFYYRSDHYNFAKNNIPVIFYFNGVHEDYHQHTDTVDKIHFEKMEVITRLVFHTAWKLANRDERIVVDKVNDFN